MVSISLGKIKKPRYHISQTSLLYKKIERYRRSDIKEDAISHKSFALFVKWLINAIVSTGQDKRILPADSLHSVETNEITVPAEKRWQIVHAGRD